MNDPRHPRARVGIVGAGRLGCALALALQDAGCTVTGASSRSPEGRARASALLGLDATASVEEAVLGADVAILAVPDDAIDGVVACLAETMLGPPRLTVLTSGCASLRALDRLVDHGGATARLHPLVALTRDARGAALSGAVAAVDGSGPEAREQVEALARAAGLRTVEVADADRVAWHAAATLAANASVALLADALELAARAGVDAATSLDAFGRLALGAVERAVAEGPARALTGPVSRGDAGTVATHLAWLDAEAPELAPTYRALSSDAARLARDAGRLDDDGAARIARALDAAVVG
ncbi:MAG: Ketopantoate reductase PanG [Thermoleophilia bacterium]|nr:Ketopantoate reductase PanG [Thermoleophilia bacterium]